MFRWEGGGERRDGGVVIHMPEERRGYIEKKLEEYKQRLKKLKGKRGPQNLDPFISPGILSQELGNDTMPPSAEIGTVYKIRVAEALLQNGKVDTDQLRRDLRQEHGDLNVARLNNACAVIADYCRGTSE